MPEVLKRYVKFTNKPFSIVKATWLETRGSPSVADTTITLVPCVEKEIYGFYVITLF